MERIVTGFKKLKDTKTVAFYYTVEEALDRIKKGKSKELVEKIRAEKDPDKKAELKNESICVCFSGKFITRADNSLEQHSGLAILDFDKVDNVDELKNELKEDKYIFACWVSPSGNGVKALVKFPRCDKDEHKQYYEELENYFIHASFDKSNKNVSRIAFESYDPNIYVNENSDIWTNKKVDEGFNLAAGEMPKIPLTDEGKIIDRLFKWWDKNFGYVKGERNNNLFVLASSFNDYGINLNSSVNFMLTNFDLPEKEIVLLNRSAYKKVASFGSKAFEDNDRLKNIKSQISKGVSKAEIKRDLEKFVSPEDADEIISEIKDSVTNFWTIKETKSGETKIIIDNADFKIFLQKNGFFKYYAEKSETPIFVRVQSNIVNTSSVDKIKDFVLKYLEELSLYDVWNYLTSGARFFSDKYLNMLDSIELSMLEDKENKAFIYFKNGVVEVSKKEVNLIDYIDVDGYIWENQIINREFKQSEQKENDFKDLVSKVSDNNEQRLKSLEHTLGYLMHSYKDKTDQKAIILNDQEISDSDDPNGGSGKSLMLTALSYFKKVVKIDGKAFDPHKSDFVYQRVDLDTQILAFDDVKKNFNFEGLFSLITEGITVNKKNKDEIFIPFERSPKVIITTNYVINGSGNSHDRRRHEIEFNQYFNGKRTPLTEYGKLLFDQWTADEWSAFDNYMIGNLQNFLNNGLTEAVTINRDKKRFISSTSKDFFDWIEDGNLKTGVKYYSAELKIDFAKEYNEQENRDLSGKRFMTWIRKYADFKGYEIKTGKDSGRFFRLFDFNTKFEDDDDEIF